MALGAGWAWLNRQPWGNHISAIPGKSPPQLHALAPSEGSYRFVGIHDAGQDKNREQREKVKGGRLWTQIKGSCNVQLSGVILITLILECGHQVRAWEEHSPSTRYWFLFTHLKLYAFR